MLKLSIKKKKIGTYCNMGVCVCFILLFFINNLIDIMGGGI